MKLKQKVGVSEPLVPTSTKGNDHAVIQPGVLRNGCD